MSEKPTYEELEQRVRELEQTVSECKKTEDALKESKEELRLFVEHAPTALAMFDHKMRYIAFNRRWMEDYRLGDRNIVGRSHYEIFPEIPDRWKEAHRRGLAGETVQAEEDYFVRMNGTVQWLYWAVRPWRKADGTVGGIVILTLDITERKKAEEALRESQRKIRSIFLAAPIGIGVVSDRIFQDVNERFCKISGYSKNELIGQSSRIIYPTDEDYEYVGSATYSMIEESGKGAVETRFKRKDGKIINVLLSSTLLDPADLSGEVTFTALDITERKLAEEALRKSKEKYQNLYNNAPDMYFSVSPDGVVNSVNQFGADYLGYTKEELIGDQIWTIVYKDDLDTIKKQVAEIFNKKLERSELEFRKVRKDGSILWVSEHTQIVLDENNNPIEIWIICSDITERKQAEEELRKSEEKYRYLVENINDIIYEIDKNGVMTYISKVAETITGYNQSELVGRNIFDFIHGEDLPRIQQQLQKVLSGQIDPSEYRFIKKTGEIIWIRSSSRPIYEEGNPVGLRGVAADISKTKKMEDQLRQSEKMEAIGTLAGGIAHDFNNILAIIIGYTELAIGDIPEWNPVNEYLKEIQTASLRAKDVVRHILSFSRKTVMDRKPIKIDSIIEDSLKMLRASIPTDIQIRQNISYECDMIQADPTQVSQVLINLCTNATHAMRDEGGILEVSLQNVEFGEQNVELALGPGRYVRLAVSDTGHGIDPENMERIFDPYFTTKEQGEGTGLGLPVVQGIVKTHNGAVTVKSEPGKGTVFEMLFPATEGEVEPEVAGIEVFPTGNEKILLIDDEESILNLVKKRLEMQGYRVEAKKDPVGALELFRSGPDRFDLIITDMTMPKMTGDKLAQSILGIRSDMPIILCSGYSDKIDTEKSTALGIRRYIEKPLNMSDFLVSVRKVLDEAKSSAQR